MSILKFAGFDIFPGQADAGNTLPVNGAGIAGTPYATQFPYVTSANHLMGVSNLPQHKLGSGAKLRNGLVAYRPAGTSTQTLIALQSGAVMGQGAWSRVFNFTVKDISPTDVNTALGILTVGTSTTSLSAYVFGINANRGVMVNGSAVPGVLWDRNREYAVEVKLWRAATDGNNVINIQVKLDGVVLQTATMSPMQLGTAQLWVNLGMNSATNINSARTMVFGDIVVSDGDYLGPQQVLPLVVDTVVSAGGWEKDGNADPVTTLSDYSDASLYNSPTDAGALAVKLKCGEDTAVAVKAAQFYVRSSRSADAGRGMQVRAEDSAGTVIGGPALISNTTTFGDYKAFDINVPTVGDLNNTTLKISAVVP